MSATTPGPDKGHLTPRTVSLYDLLNESLTPTDWVVRGILPAGELALTYGPAHSGKTFAIIDLGLAVAAGLPWHGYPVPQARPVLYVPSEGRRGIGRRCAATIAHYYRHRPLDTIDFTLYDEGLDLTGQDGDASYLRLARHVEEREVGLLVVDVFSDFTAGVDENAREFGHALNRLRDIAKRYACAVIAVHHSGKDLSRGPRGHSSQDGSADLKVAVTASTLVGPDGRPFATAIRLENTKNRNEDNFGAITLDLRKLPDSLAPFVVGLWDREEGGEDNPSRLALLQAVAALQKEGQEADRTRLGEHLGWAKNTARDCAAQAVAAGLLTEEARANRRKVYALTPAGAQVVGMTPTTSDNPTTDNPRQVVGVSHTLSATPTTTGKGNTDNDFRATGSRGPDNRPDNLDRPPIPEEVAEAIEAQEAGMTLAEWRTSQEGPPEAEDGPVAAAWETILTDLLGHNTPEAALLQPPREGDRP